MDDYSNTLYVIFHGTWGFYDSQNEGCVHAYTPDIPEHVYIGGSWLGEIKIRRGETLELANVDNCDEDGNESTERIFNYDKGFVLLPKAAACPVGAYAEVRLPRPLAIHPLQVVAVDGKGQLTIQQPAGGKPTSFNLGLNPVFEYRLKPDTRVRRLPELTPFWTPLVTDGDAAANTLHFYAADDESAKQENADTDFEACVRLLGVEAQLITVAGAHVTPGDFPDGLVDRQFEVTLSLFQRLAHLRGVGYQMRYGHVTDLSWNAPIPVPLVGDASCGGGGGGS